MNKCFIVFLSLFLLVSCGKKEMKYWQQVKLPSGFNDSHILSITTKGDQLLLGTYGRGALLSGPSGLQWTVFDTSKGLSWDFILGGDWNKNYIVLATLGDGVNISTDGGKKWERYGFNFFGIEYLYAVGAMMKNGRTYIPTADGLVIFDDIKNWHSLTEKDGLPSQYLYDIAMRGDTIALGTLHGYAISYDNGATWKFFSPNGRMTPDNLPACKARAVEFSGQNLYAGCDDGLFSSSDGGNSWARLSQHELSSDFIHDLVFDQDGKLWIATYKEIANYSPQTKSWQVFHTTDGLPGGSINCLAITANGRILAGTNYGLFQFSHKIPLPTREGEIDTMFDQTERPVHQWMLRPVGPDDQNCRDQTYLYGSTMGGNFRQHQGNEYNNPEGIPLLAVDNGVIVFTDSTIGHTVLKCDTKQEGKDVFAHYHHQSKILKKVGDRVARGDTIGEIGKKGNVTNEHLHFEMAYSDMDSPKDHPSHTRNSELWIAPLPGCGTIVGQLVDKDDKPVQGARIYGLTKPIPSETPFSFAETYKDAVNSDESYNENFAIGDVPEGDYVIYSNTSGMNARIRVHVASGKVTNVKMQLK